MADPGQIVLMQSAVQLDANGRLEARFTAGLPARGRRIDGAAAIDLLLRRVPDILARTLLEGAHDDSEIERCAALNEDADALRDALAPRGLVGFLANGSVLPRRSGVDDRPLEAGAVPFESPPSLGVEVELPNRGVVSGMGIPEGITLIVGGGFHGKSTLLRALQAGVWNHAPRDGRDLVVSRADAVKIRAEDGRAVAGVDISPFIENLPGTASTRPFTSTNASGSTSQAAAIVEALESGAGVLLIDEDTSATNFMIRDRRMQELVPSDGEPITPFVDRIQELRRERNVSTVLVLGGSGDYLDVADHVVRMDSWRASDVTERARATAAAHPTGRRNEARGPMTPAAPRRISWATVDAARGRRATNVKGLDARTLLFGHETIDLVALEQLAGVTQTRTIGLALAWAARSAVPRDMPSALNAIAEALDEGLDTFDPYRTGDLAEFRRQDVAAVLNRLRTLRVD